MAPEEIVRFLRAVRYGRLTIQDICRAANLSRQTVYVAMNGGTLSPPVQRRLTHAIARLAERQSVHTASLKQRRAACHDEERSERPLATQT